MRRFQYLWLSRCLLLLLLANSTIAFAKPNVLFIAVDDLKPAIGCYGDALAKTPNIDRLAERGMVFERAYCMQAVCSPSRNGVLTGLRPQTLRIYDLATNFRTSVPNVVTLPQHFKNLGWKTEALGKIYHVGQGNHDDQASWSMPHWQPKGQAYAVPTNRPQKVTKEKPKKQRKRQGKESKGTAVEAAAVPDNAYGDGKIADEAIERLRQAKANPNQPFFLAVGFHKPHLPFVAPQKYWDLHDPAKFPLPTRLTPPEGAPAFAPTLWGELRQYTDIPKSNPLSADQTRHLIHGYYAAASYMDAQLGRVLHELDQLGLSDNTIVVLWGDHGWHLGDHGMWCKHTNYEQATRAPFIIAGPGQAKGQRTSELAEFVDIYPTLCDLAAIDKPSHLQGESLIATFDEGAKRTEEGNPSVAFQVYPRSSKEHGPLLGQAVRTDGWRYIEWQASDRKVIARELYDMRQDPGETVNLADVAAHATEIAEHSSLIQAQLDKPNPKGLEMLPIQKSQ